VTIILPEAAKLMQSGDASMVHTVVSLSAVTSLCQCPLDTLIVTLQHASQVSSYKLLQGLGLVSELWLEVGRVREKVRSK
jgi:hypothetical protein